MYYQEISDRSYLPLIRKKYCLKLTFLHSSVNTLPGWLSGECVGLKTWWLRVRSPVEAKFLSSVFSPPTSAEACKKSSRWLWKEKLCYYWCEKARKGMCVTDRHDMTLAFKVALNPITTRPALININKS